MRYIAKSDVWSLDMLEAELRRVGARNVKEARLLKQVFCDLDEAQAKALVQVGVELCPVDQCHTHTSSTVVVPGAVTTLPDVWYLLRSYLSPPLTGAGLTVAVLDSGIRKTHQALVGKVVYEVNTTTTASSDDLLGHGTAVASVLCGGRHAAGEFSGVAPGASIINVKVFPDAPNASTEDVIQGIEAVCEMVDEARRQGCPPTHPMHPNAINLSLGVLPETDTADHPLRVACRLARQDYGLDVIASAGNDGPDANTINVPASDPEVVAVGAVETLGELVVWEKSSRGPTQEGLVKPDLVMWGADVEAAGNTADDAWVRVSGTSFSTPMVAGLGGLVGEALRRVYGEGVSFNWGQVLPLAPLFCIKESGAPLEKDNDYGYGLPAMPFLLRDIAPRADRYLEPMAASVGMVLATAMLGMVIRSTIG